MPLGHLINQVVRHGGAVVAKRLNNVFAPSLSTGLLRTGVRVASTDCNNNMCMHANVNQQLLKAEVWYDLEGLGNVRLNLADNPRAELFANSAKNMQGGIQASLHDLAVCASLTHMKRAGAHLSMNIQFLAPVPIAETKEVTVVAKVLEKTLGHVFVDSKLYADTKLASTASHVIRAKPIQTIETTTQPQAHINYIRDDTAVS